MRKVIPPLFVFACLVLMGTIHFLFRPERQIHFPLNTTGILLIVLGLAMIAWVGQLFKKIKTEIHTFKDPGSLVTKGLFQYSRNPIYLGFGLLLTGFSILSGTCISFVFPVVFFLVANFWYIPTEEKNMKRIFGKKYSEYQSRTRRWI